MVVWRDRDRGAVSGGPEQTDLLDDNTWGFGQVFPLVLLILPLVSFFEVAYGKLLLFLPEQIHDRHYTLILLRI